MKYFFTLIISTLILTVTMGQAEMATWSQELKVGGYERIIAKVDNHVFVQRSRREHFEDQDYESELARYDSKGQVTHIIPVDELEKQDYQEITAINTNLGIAVIYLTTDPSKKKNFLLAAQLYDHATLAPMDIVDLMSIRYRRLSKPKVGDYRSRTSVIDIDYELSEDLSKIALFYTEEQIGKDDYTMVQYSVLDLENALTEINAGTIETALSSDKYLISDYTVDRFGNTAVLMKEYEDDRSLEFVDRRPGYRYSLYYEGRDSNSFVYDIPFKKYFVDVMLSAFDDEGNVYLTGLIREKPGNDIYGTVLTKITSAGELGYHKFSKYDKADVKKIRNKEKDHIQSQFDVIDVKVANDVVYGIYQYSTVRLDRDVNNTSLRNNAFGNNFNNQRFDYREYNYKEHVLIHGFSPSSGERAWTAVNPRRQSDFNFYEYWTYGNIHLVDNSLVLLYNERKDTPKRLKNGKNPKNTDFPAKKTVVNLVQVSSSGTMSSRAISEESHFYIPYEGSLINNGAISLLKVRKNFRSFHIGRVKL